MMSHEPTTAEWVSMFKDEPRNPRLVEIYEVLWAWNEPSMAITAAELRRILEAAWILAEEARRAPEADYVRDLEEKVEELEEALHDCQQDATEEDVEEIRAEARAALAKSEAERLRLAEKVESLVQRLHDYETEIIQKP